MLPASASGAGTGAPHIRVGRALRTPPIKVKASTAMWPAKFPRIENVFYLIECKSVAPDGLFNINISIQREPGALILEIE